MTRNRFLLALSILALVVTAEAQDPWVYPGILARIAAGRPANIVQTAVSTHVPILIKYIGTNANGGTVAVAAGGSITLSTGPVGSSAVSTATECPISGALGGVIDVTNAACDTWGEVVDAINGKCSTCVTTEWRAVLLDALRSDSSNDTAATLSEAAANSADGLGLLGDTAVTFDVQRAAVPREFRSIKAYLQPGTNVFLQKPFANYRTVLTKCIETSTYGSGSSTFEIIGDVQTYSLTQPTATETSLWSQAGGATTVATTVDFQPGNLWSDVGEKVIVRINNSAAMTAPNLTCSGTTFKVQ